MTDKRVAAGLVAGFFALCAWAGTAINTLQSKQAATDERLAALKEALMEMKQDGKETNKAVQQILLEVQQNARQNKR